MTQMTQSRGIPWAPDLRRLGHLGHTKTNDPNDPKHNHAGAGLQFKTMTQMTQMTQELRGRLAPACSMQHAAQWPRGRPACGRWQIPTMLGGVWVGPAAKGRQKRTGHEQFFLYPQANCF